MLPINYSRYKYTPDEMPRREFLERFVVRDGIFEEIFRDIQHSDFTVPGQHYIIIGQRGQGKTTLLRKLQIEVEEDKKLSKFLIPVKFAEEQYQIRSLSRLWEEVADYLQSLHEELFPHILDDMEEHFEDEDYELNAFGYLDMTLKKKKKKLLLLIDNIDELIGKLHEKEQRRLREILLSSSSFRIVGGSTKMLEQHYDYGKPFYEFFKIIKLRGFTREESITFLRSIGTGEQKERIEEIIRTNPARIETLRQLTGGVPRTLVMLFDIFLDEGGNAFDDLLKVLDEATPLYKHRIDELPAQLQEIVHTIAINWDGMYTAEIAQKTRLSTKVISAQLGKLEKYDIIESEQAGKNKIYKIKERFFNIWYLMRFGRKKDRQRVEWLVRFLESWCSQEERNARAEKLISKVQEGNITDSHAFFMTEALGYSDIDLELEIRLKRETKKYLNKINSNYFDNVSEDQIALLLKAIKSIKNENFILAEHYINNITTSDHRMLAALNQLEDMKKTKLKVNQQYQTLVQRIENLCDSLVALRDKVSAMEIIQGLKANHYETEMLKVWTYLCYDEFQKSEDFVFKTWRISQKVTARMYLLLLISKEQYYQAKNILENKEFNLKEQYKPIWYALMTLMQDDFPHEIKKMGSELQESVDEVLQKVEEYRKRYA